MRNTDILTAKYKNIILQYEVRGRVIVITKHIKDKPAETKYILVKCDTKTQRKLWRLLWYAKATPCTAKELAEELLERIIK